MEIVKHFRTITRHKNMVMRDCFKVGLIKQGLLHDLSKYSPTEFFVGCKYYKGYMSPNNMEREEKGYSSAWLHHKGRNKHHLEYWIDYAGSEISVGEHKGMTGMKMPIPYVCEMLIDRVCASKNYQKEKYTKASAYEYYCKGRDHYMMHEDTRSLLEFLLIHLLVKGEKETYSLIKKEVLKEKVPYSKSELEPMIAKLKRESDYFIEGE